MQEITVFGLFIQTAPAFRNWKFNVQLENTFWSLQRKRQPV